MGKVRFRGHMILVPNKDPSPRWNVELKLLLNKVITLPTYITNNSLYPLHIMDQVYQARLAKAFTQA
jgi:hypothetical protein